VRGSYRRGTWIYQEQSLRVAYYEVSSARKGSVVHPDWQIRGQELLSLGWVTKPIRLTLHQL
jgi:hypothetical protein